MFGQVTRNKLNFFVKENILLADKLDFIYAERLGV